MGNFFKMLAMLIGGAIVLTIFALIYFALAFTAMSAMGASMGDPSSIGEQAGVVAAIAGTCAGLLIAMAVAGDKLKTADGKAPIVVLIVGWVLVVPIVGAVLIGVFGAAFDAVLQYKTLGILSVLLYGAIVGWAVRKITRTRR